MADDLAILNQGTGEVTPYEQQGTSIETSRATAESQAGFIMAKQFPRNEDACLNKILNSCRRVGLAENAEYAFPKGGITVMGPSVRLAEAVAQQWGNILFGIREMEQKDGETVMQAYCYDLESNARAERIFTVKHTIKLKSGEMKTLTDPRDIYEMNFNMGARRKRACILEVIPGDVVELAVEACRATLEAEGQDASPEAIAKMVEAFEEIGVSKEQIEMRQSKNTEALVASELGMLRKIYKSIKDGMSTPEKWFGEELIEEPKAKKKPEPKPKKKATKKKTTKKKAEKPAEEPPPAPEGDPEPDPIEPSPSASEDTASQSATEEELPLGGEMVDPEDDGSNPTITDKIESVKFVTEGKTKKGNPWKLWHVITANGTKLSCFDEGLFTAAESACTNEYVCELEYQETEKGNKLLGIELLG